MLYHHKMGADSETLSLPRASALKQLALAKNLVPLLPALMLGSTQA